MGCVLWPRRVDRDTLVVLMRAPLSSSSPPRTFQQMDRFSYPLSPLSSLSLRVTRRPQRSLHPMSTVVLLPANLLLIEKLSNNKNGFGFGRRLNMHLDVLRSPALYLRGRIGGLLEDSAFESPSQLLPNEVTNGRLIFPPANTGQQLSNSFAPHTIATPVTGDTIFNSTVFSVSPSPPSSLSSPNRESPLKYATMKIRALGDMAPPRTSDRIANQLRVCVAGPSLIPALKLRPPLVAAPKVKSLA